MSIKSRTWEHGTTQAAGPEYSMGRGQRAKIVVKNSAVTERETKIEGSSAGVGIPSSRLHVARGGKSLEDIPEKHCIGEAF